jgi:hypothetical protein
LIEFTDVEIASFCAEFAANTPDIEFDNDPFCYSLSYVGIKQKGAMIQMEIEAKSGVINLHSDAGDRSDEMESDDEVGRALRKEKSKKLQVGAPKKVDSKSKKGAKLSNKAAEVDDSKWELSEERALNRSYLWKCKRCGKLVVKCNRIKHQRIH